MSLVILVSDMTPIRNIILDPENPTLIRQVLVTRIATMRLTQILPVMAVMKMNQMMATTCHVTLDAQCLSPTHNRTTTHCIMDPLM